ncbi:MAG TPA: 3-deoxy-7-phosphoheptulonate synthase [Polyangia bacterium]
MLQTTNLRIAEFAPLVTPRQLEAELAPTEGIRAMVVASRAAISAMIHGQDQHRLVVVVGPCSIHDPEAAFAYAERLKKVAASTREHLLVVMRTYFEKPRTVVGWKGLVSDPHLDGSCEISDGLTLARKVLLRITALGLPCATEFLDTVVPHYLSDMVSWAAIGARTTESQVHRQMASGLSMPVGFKNSTDGALQNATNAMLSARHAHAFLGINADGISSVVKTLGNQDAHVVLRGGASGTNYHPEDIAIAAKAVGDEGLARGVMVDCSHDNSGKDHTKQGPVLAEVVQNFASGQKAILGVMIESNLHAGKQTWMQGVPLKYGVSITDSCISWEETEQILLGAASLLAKGH